MAENKTLQTRIALKTDNSTNWQNHGTFVPLEGEAVIIQDLSSSVMPNGWDIKIGHNNTAVSNLKGLGEGLQEWVRNELKVADALIFKGIIYEQNDIPTTGMQIGWTYKVGKAGSYTLGTTSTSLQLGDLIIWGEKATSGSSTDLNPDGTTTRDDTDGWMVVQSNITGATFTGTPFTITHPAHNALKSVSSKFAGTTVNIVHNITPAGNVAVTHSLSTNNHKHTFTGTETAVSVSGTATGTISNTSITPAGTVTAEFTGTAGNHTHTFNGTAASHKHNFTGTAGNATASYTPAGTVASATVTPSGTVASTFTGDEATISVTGTPAGSVAVSAVNGTINSHKHSFNGTKANISVPYTAVTSIAETSITPAGTVSSTFAGTQGNVSVSGSVNGNTGSTSIKPTGNVTIAFAGEANNAVNQYTPKGTVGSHNHSIGAPSTTTVKQVSTWNAGALPTYKAGTSHTNVTRNLGLSYVENATTKRPLTVLTWTSNTTVVGSGTFTAGSLPSLATADITVVTGIPSSTGNKQPSFTGTAATITPTFTGDSASHSHSVGISNITFAGKFTPAGNVTSTFSGTAASHTHGFSSENKTSVVEYTPAGTINNVSLAWTFKNAVATFTGTPIESTGVYTPEGSVNSTFTGTAGTHTHGFSGTAATITSSYTPAGTISNTSITPAGSINTVTITPAGSITNTKFTGTAASHSHTFTGTAHTSTGKFTPQGTINTVTNLPVSGTINATFTGAEGVINYSYTPEGTITNTYGWNNKAASTETITPAGTIALTTTE